ALQFTLSWLTTGASGSNLGVTGTAVAIASAITYVASTVFRFGKYRYEWLDTFQKMGGGYNHAYIGLAEGQYFNFVPNAIPSSTLRGLDISSYLNTGNRTLTQETTGQRYFVNNFQRERSVFFKTQDLYPVAYNPS